MTTTSNDNDDGGTDEKDDETNDIPSEDFRTKNSEFAPKFHMVAEPSRPATIPTTRSDDYHPSSSTSARLVSTSLPPTSWTASGEHPQRCRHRVDPHELPDHLWRLPSTSALDPQLCQLHGCISRHQAPASQAVRHHAPRPHLQQGVTPIDLASTSLSSPSSSRPAASSSPRLAASVCAVASPAATTTPSTEETRRELRVQHPSPAPSGSSSSSTTTNHIDNNNCNHCIHCIDWTASTACIFYTTFTTFSYYSFHITDDPAEFHTGTSSASTSTSQRDNFRESTSTSEGKTSRTVPS